MCVLCLLCTAGSLPLQITFNGGGQWTQLQKPTRFNYEECNACKDVDPAKCQLHLHGPTGWVEGLGQPCTFHHHSPPLTSLICHSGLRYASDVSHNF